MGKAGGVGEEGPELAVEAGELVLEGRTRVMAGDTK